MSDTDWRGLCEELASHLQGRKDRECGWPEEDPEQDLLDRARAALAQPEPEVVGPSDKELLELMPGQLREDLATVSRMAAHGAGTGVTPGLFRVSLNTGALAYARAVLARFGHQPEPPAEGEVAELVEWLQDDLELYPAEKRRAADLLSQRHPTPVPVSERLPGPEDCDALGYCWWWDPFRRESWEYCITGGNPDWYWLPFNALPLPAGKVE